MITTSPSQLSSWVFSALLLTLTGCCKTFDDPVDKNNKPEAPAPKYRPHTTGGYLQFTANSNTPTEETLVGADPNVLILKDKKTVPLDIESGSDEAIIDRNNVKIGESVYERFAVSGNKYHAIKFGAMKMGGEAIVFSQGYPTEIMPETGVAAYQGDSVLHLPSIHFEGKGTFASVVDFSAKRVTILLNTLNAPSYPIEFKGSIRGNTFASDDKAVISQGGFYGNNAEEMSGYFVKGQDVGSFGGKK